MKTLKLTIAGGLFAAAAVLGTIAVTRTVSLGPAHNTRASDATALARARKLNHFEASLQRALAKKPPALPPIPKTLVAAQHPAPVTAQQSAPVAAQQPAAPQPRVVYRRPPPIVVVRHVHHGDGGAASDGEGSGD
jgi:hypothetical protein